MAVVGSSLHQSKPRKASQAPRHCWALSEPGDPMPRPCSETTAPTSSTGGKTSWVFTLSLSVSLKFYGKEISKELIMFLCYHTLWPVYSSTLFWPMLELVVLSLVFVPNLHSKTPSLERLESVSQARLCKSSNPLFHKHPCPDAAAWTITSNMSLSVWITRERDLSCCRRFTYGIFSAAA